MSPPYASNGHDNLDSVVEKLAKEQPQLLVSTHQDWLKKERRIAQMYPEQRVRGKMCEFVPRDLNGYVRHVAEMAEAENRAVARSLGLQNEYARSQNPVWALPLAFGGRRFGESPFNSIPTDLADSHHPNHPMRTPVLSQLSYWQRWAPPFGVPWRPFVDWPCSGEMSWEGDQRAASENGRYGRFPPLPRRSDYSGYVPWQLKAYVKPWPLDEVWRVPQMDDILLPVDEIEDPEVISLLLNSDLLKAIDSDDIPVPSEKIRLRIATQ